jgi:hypothetical protein
MKQRQAEFPKHEFDKAAAYLKHLETQPYPPDSLSMRPIGDKWVVTSCEKDSGDLIADYWKKYGEKA